jgi:DNA-directed RNA polymerase specialized sigma24 family protein
MTACGSSWSTWPTRTWPKTSSPRDSPGRALVTALRRLPVRQRQVITLRLLLDLDTETTARVLGISGGTVSAHLKRALDALRGELGPPWPQQTPLRVSGVSR